jgi:sulfur-carrier protein adenylyltransferase/sulfurtransferase
MASFRFSKTPIDVASLRVELADPTCGGYTSFEGLVRNHNEGLSVRHLEYEAFEPLAVKEGERIVEEAIKKFGIERAACVHRIGDLAIGEMAVWVGASARHRDEAFRACRYIIDEVKHRVPIWKKEHYENGDSGWVNCERCAAPSAHEPTDVNAHDHQHATTAGSHAHSHGHDNAHDHSHAHAATPPLGASPAHDPTHRHQDGPAITTPIPTVHLTPRSALPAPDYSRQMALKEVGARGQGKLRASSVLVVGCGGLGVPVISYLAGAGIGRLGLVDGDHLEASNLHRQTMYALADVGRPKGELAAARVRALNPDVETNVHTLRLDATNAADLVTQYDLIIDCTDNFSTKFMLNDVCVQHRKPVIFSSVYQYEGQLQVVRPDRDGACLRCIWPEATRDGIVGNCAEAGVLGPVPGTFGSLQAFEALKLLLDLPGQLGQELLVLDLLTMSISRVRTKRAATCPDHARTALATQTHSAQASASADSAPVELEFASLEDAQAAGYAIVDIREAQELRAIPTPAKNAKHVPMAELLHGKQPFNPTGKQLLVCASGKRSLAAAQELRARGLNTVYSLAGGIANLSQHAPA